MTGLSGRIAVSEIVPKAVHTDPAAVLMTARAGLTAAPIIAHVGLSVVMIRMMN
jgi:hypothetical protein